MGTNRTNSRFHCIKSKCYAKPVVKILLLSSVWFDVNERPKNWCFSLNLLVIEFKCKQTNSELHEAQ